MKQLEQEKKDISSKNKSFNYNDSNTTTSSLKLLSRDMQDNNNITIEKIEMVPKSKAVRSGMGKGLSLRKY